MISVLFVFTAVVHTLRPLPAVINRRLFLLQPSDSSKQEYETRIAALCKRLQHLESEVGDAVNRPEGSRLSQVERQLAKQTELYNDQSSRLSKLQVDYNKVQNDYHAQLEVSLLFLHSIFTIYLKDICFATNI